MKTKLIIVAAVIIGITGCSKDDDTSTVENISPAPSGNANTGNVPANIVGKWLHGTFAMASYYAYDGSYLGNPFTQSVAFDFKANGEYEMFYAGQSNNFGCITSGLSNFKGTVNFSDSTFTVHPQQGTFRGYYSCTPQYDFSRPAAASELKVQTFYYHFETDNSGKKWFVVGFIANDPYPSYFSSTTW